MAETQKKDHSLRHHSLQKITQINVKLFFIKYIR